MNHGIEPSEAGATKLRQAEFACNIYLGCHENSIFIRDNNK
jgi:hypothetical protein